VLTAKKLRITKITEARKEKITADPAWELLKAAQKVIAGKGKKFITFDPAQDDKEAILKSCLGRTGNLRAPTIITGDLVIVGFTQDMYEQFVGQL